MAQESGGISKQQETTHKDSKTRAMTLLTVLKSKNR